MLLIPRERHRSVHLEFTPGKTGFSVMAEIEFNVDLKVGFRLDFNTSNTRKALENAQKCPNTRYFFRNHKPFFVTRVPRVGMKEEMVTRRWEREDLVRNETETRLWRILRAEKFHFIIEIIRSH